MKHRQDRSVYRDRKSALAVCLEVLGIALESSCGVELVKAVQDELDRGSQRCIGQVGTALVKTKLGTGSPASDAVAGAYFKVSKAAFGFWRRGIPKAQRPLFDELLGRGWEPDEKHQMIWSFETALMFIDARLFDHSGLYPLSPEKVAVARIADRSEALRRAIIENRLEDIERLGREIIAQVDLPDIGVADRELVSGRQVAAVWTCWCHQLWVVNAIVDLNGVHSEGRASICQ